MIDLRGAQAMWREVLIVAIREAAHTGDLSYFSTPDFEIVAGFAGIDADAARQALARGAGRRRFRSR